jgi:hypothetical protein
VYIKVFPRGKGGGSGPVDYATRPDDPQTRKPRQVAPEVVKGEPEQTRRLIDSIDNKWKYTSGVCSWAPGEVVTPEQEQELIAEFEKVAFAGLEEHQRDILWVRHQHADHHELHFITPRVELETGKALNAFAPGWQKDFDPLRDKFNYQHGWSRPDDPQLKRLYEPGPGHLNGSKEEIRQAVTDYITAEIEAGKVTDRASLKQALEEAGVAIAKEGKSYVTILDEEGQRHRLKGGIYEATWTLKQHRKDFAQASRADPERDREAVTKRVAELERELERVCQKRAEYNQRRYQSAEQRLERVAEREHRARAERASAAAQKTAAVAASAPDLPDYMREQCGNDYIASVLNGPEPSAETSRDRNHESNTAAESNVGPGNDREPGRQQIHNPSPRQQVRNGVQQRKPESRKNSQRLKNDYKQKLMQKLIQTDADVELWKVRWVDQQHNFIDFQDNGRLLVSENKFEAQNMSAALAAHRVIAASQAAGWQDVQLWGSDEFVKRAAVLALEKGMEPSARDEHQLELIEQVRKEHTHDSTRKAVEQSIERNARAALAANAEAAKTSEQLDRACSRADRALQQPRSDLESRMRVKMDSELDQMKRINIADYAAAQGYTLNKQKSSQHSLCFDNAAGDRVLIGQDPKSGHSVYCSVRDDQDNGTIVDFIQKRQGLNLGQVRRELRPWIGAPSQRPSYTPQPVPKPAEKDRLQVQRGLADCKLVSTSHNYLESRGIEQKTLEHFRGRVYADKRGNAIFPHFDEQGVCGLEIKNQNFTGFSKAGEKGLWIHAPKNAERIVFCESAIDCMSHYQCNPDNKTAYVSIGGNMSPKAKETLERLLEKHSDKELVAAFDNDKQGEKYTQYLHSQARREIKLDKPERKDWNEQLQREQEREYELQGPQLSM